MHRITDDERRARLARRHFLAPTARGTDVTAIAGALVGLHGSDPASVFLSAAARLKRPERAVPALERALYEDRTLVRTLCMRRTMFVLPVELVPVVQAAATDALVPGERKRLVQLLEDQGITKDGKRWLRKVENETVAAIEARGEATASQLAKDVPGLRHQLSFGEGKTWGGKVGVSTRVLFLLSTEQRVVRGRPNGGWTSSQYRWAPMDAWLPDAVPRLGAPEARSELARRWLATFGPGTTTDLKWWTGWTVAQTKAALASVDAVPVLLDGDERDDTGDEGAPSGWVLPDDLARVRSPKPWVALLPGLDPATMGWKERAWYLGDHGPALFDTNGNAGPTVWVDGRVVGGWAQRRDGSVVTRLLEDVGRTAIRAVDAAAASLGAWFGEVRVTTRFGNPLTKELVG